MSSGPLLVLTFAASDPTGGAGMQADVLTIAALGCHPLSVLTGVTVQDTSGVRELHALDARLVAAQASCVLGESRASAIKVGVVASAANARAIAAIAKERDGAPLVLDPVLASGGGDRLADEATLAALRESLIPRAMVVTPNGVEARRLTGEKDIPRCAARLIEMGARYALVTGGHENGAEVVNRLYGREGLVREDAWPRLPHEYHGSGCTLASAIACSLARGVAMAQAVYEAQKYAWHALDAAFMSGHGQRIPQRFHGRADGPS